MKEDNMPVSQQSLLVELFLRDIGECSSPGPNGVSADTRHQELGPSCRRAHNGSSEDLLDLFSLLSRRVRDEGEEKVKAFLEKHSLIFGPGAYQKFAQLCNMDLVAREREEKTNCSRPAADS